MGWRRGESIGRDGGLRSRGKGARMAGESVGGRAEGVGVEGRGMGSSVVEEDGSEKITLSFSTTDNGVRVAGVNLLNLTPWWVCSPSRGLEVRSVAKR